MDLNLRGKRAIVTGGSGGLGRAIALALAREGMDITLVARNAEALAGVAAECTAAGSTRADSLAVDLMDRASADTVVASSAGRAVDVLVNCAGATKRGDFFSLTDKDWADGFELKFFGTMRMCRALWPSLAASRGAIVNIVGAGSRTPSADFAIGGSVNSALLNFTKALADRGRTDGVRVNAINPGYFLTDRLEHRIVAAMNADGRTREAVESGLLAGYRISRFGHPEELGGLVAFMASDAGSYLHGAIVDLDGGATKGL
ncbi:SDR family NAD(P)-dependent oxidoreductase [Chelatococcus asaccharovorans]|uniref:Short-subunit dehydrogenase n=1 Tax=Chelatococcus asaccharovorans TaxID=28210 RepID=A0A2V3U5X0_9HYPH|nr:SDR family NAD(P)-dependent oxidoreductase [Chelatococcus asaccharovorans]MBS7703726.1 SDR family NAD(P)-dependent oxidoreductase [Chelatococcus asaccharovorans]PXW57884.1 short-subunit dehydrogenase [Chelatococcus asaccharovorans]